MTLRADSTATLSASGGSATAEGRWQLVGDTIVYSSVRMKGLNMSLPNTRRLVKLDGKLLTITKFEAKDSGEPKSRVYERVESTQASPAKP